MVTDPGLYRLNLDEYHGLAAACVLRNMGRRVVLLDGLLMQKPLGSPIYYVARRLGRQALERALPDGGFAAQVDPISLPDGPSGFDSEPEPELMVVRGTFLDDRDRQPNAADVPLIIEVADRPDAIGRATPALFAWTGIPAVWNVNLDDRVVEVLIEPSGRHPEPGYQATRRFREGDTIPVVLDGREAGRVAVNDLLP